VLAPIGLCLWVSLYAAEGVIRSQCDVRSSMAGAARAFATSARGEITADVRSRQHVQSLPSPRRGEVRLSVACQPNRAALQKITPLALAFGNRQSRDPLLSVARRIPVTVTWTASAGCSRGHTR